MLLERPELTLELLAVMVERAGGSVVIEPGADLMLLHPDGKEEVLVAAPPDDDRRDEAGLRRQEQPEP